MTREAANARRVSAGLEFDLIVMDVMMPGENGVALTLSLRIAGDVAVIKFTVRAVFMKGEDQPALHDNGFWELTSGTGAFAGKRGVGALTIEPAGGSNRAFTLTGEIGDAP